MDRRRWLAPARAKGPLTWRRGNAPGAASISSECPVAGLLRAEEVSERIRRILLLGRGLRRIVDSARA